MSWMNEVYSIRHTPVSLVSPLSTSGFIVRFLPVEDDEGRAAFHCNHGDVGWRRAGRTGHILIAAFLIREVSHGGSDGAWLIWLLICLVDDMWSCTQTREEFLVFETQQTQGF